MSRKYALLLVALVAFALSAAASDDVQYRSTPEKLVLTAFEPRWDGLVLRFTDGRGKTLTPEVTVNGIRAYGVLRLPFHPEPRAYDLEMSITDSRTGAVETILLTYYPAVLYAQSGNSSKGQLIVRSSTIAIGAAPGEPFLYLPDDLAWGRARWKTSAATDSARAEEIMRAVMVELHGHTGVPSDVMSSVSPREQFERAISGRDAVWCDQIAWIFQFALTSHGIPARVVRTGSDCQNVSDICLRTVEGHTTLEYFSRQDDGWLWADPTVGVLGVSVGGSPMNLRQMINALDSPMQRQLEIRCFDPASAKSRDCAISEDPMASLIRTYFRPGVRLYF